MARVTVEDCLEKVPNRFELVLVAAKRARQLARGGMESFVPTEKDKVTVLALREIADGFVGMDILEEKTKQPEISELFARAAADLALEEGQAKKADDLTEIELATTQTAAELGIHSADADIEE